ncbi:hypothetical protein Vadar_025133 [Vaccinium darrowii]|uniref:Uncharacterized protein n=1 Tax=Vaccinium darrowii TaxID=229202 RepID=A0ACB7Y1M8_9ERIC|nr:hypothetical protein Vadar_025133 [Vaccinium darrowii]
MEVCACPSIPLWVRLSSNFRCVVSADYQRWIEFIRDVVSAVLRGFFFAILTFLFGVVVATLGATAALMGALFGFKSNRSLLHGAAAGAVAGAYFYLQFIKASVGLWISYADGPVSFLHLIVVISELLNPTLLYLLELFGSVGIQDVENQMDTDQTINEVQRLIDAGGANVSSQSSVHLLPKTRITHKNIYNNSGSRISCPICLEDFQHGEVAGILPLCHHIFHRSCIAKWHSRHSSCPLCRRSQ